VDARLHSESERKALRRPPLYDFVSHCDVRFGSSFSLPLGGRETAVRVFKSLLALVSWALHLQIKLMTVGIATGSFSFSTTNFGRLQYLGRNCDAAVFPPGSTMTRVPTRTRL
jgi:hypothetical protein